jgi:6-phosphogluconolactonase (cycloisomerase 2 family)
VANTGSATSAANVSGFRVSGNSLVAIPSSIKALSSALPHPADIAFVPGRDMLVVTERDSNKIGTFSLTAGVANDGKFTNSSGQGPFGFAFSAGGQLLVSEAQGGRSGETSVSSYAIDSAGALTVVTGSLVTAQTAACWLVVAGNTTYVTNAASGNVSGLRIAASGALSLLDPSGITGTVSSGAIDTALTPDNGFLYVLVGGTSHSIGIFSVNADGSLTKSPSLTGLPTFAAGLVAR